MTCAATLGGADPMTTNRRLRRFSLVAAAVLVAALVGVSPTTPVLADQNDHLIRRLHPLPKFGLDVSLVLRARRHWAEIVRVAEVEFDARSTRATPIRVSLLLL